MPLVLLIHGGPTGVFTDTFIARPGHIRWQRLRRAAMRF